MKERPRLGSIEVVINVASGSVAPNAPEEMARLLVEHGVKAQVHACQPAELMGQLKASVANAPDLLITLAGDGTVRAAAELCGLDGPVLAPLPGGTMNMLPHAVYGARPWPEALKMALETGRIRDLGGGCIDGHRFLCAAILGSPARLAKVRESAREGQFRVAFDQLRSAVQKAFTGRLRYELDGRPRDKAEALILICPIASKIMDAEEPQLEAAALNPTSVVEVLRLGVNAVIRDWRVDPAVDSQFCRRVRVWSARRIPALLDGETVVLKANTLIRYDPRICRVLMPPGEA